MPMRTTRSRPSPEHRNAERSFCEEVNLGNPVFSVPNRTLFKVTAPEECWTVVVNDVIGRSQAKLYSLIASENPMHLSSALDVWFRPKGFESEYLYEKFGALLIKRYVPTGGDLVMQRLRRQHPSRRWVTGSLESLHRYEQRTRLNESVHVLGFVGFTALALEKFVSGSLSPFGLTVAMTLNLQNQKQQSQSPNTTQSFIEGFWGVRYQVKDVQRAITFYTQMLGFNLDMQYLPAFGQVSIGGLKLILSGPGASGSRAMPDGRSTRARRMEPCPSSGAGLTCAQC